MGVVMRRISTVACAATLWAGCQGPALPLANRPDPHPVTGGPAAGPGRGAPGGSGGTAAPRGRTRFEDLAQPFVEVEPTPLRPGAPRITEEMIDRVERAVRLRQRAYETVPPDRGAGKRAEEIPPPSKNGDGQGICVDPKLLARGLLKLLLDRKDP